MIRFIADEYFNGRIFRGLLLRQSDLDLIRMQDAGLSGANDEKLLEWAADHDRILLTHDARTMPRHARSRLIAGASFPGLFIVSKSSTIGACIDDLLMIAECSEQDEWQDRIVYVPLI